MISVVTVARLDAAVGIQMLFTGVSKKDYFIGNHLTEISNQMLNLWPPENI